jgi:hypothetical protein
MFDLESAVKAWRQQLETNRAVDRSSLDELEDHVREDFAALVRTGKSEPDAWSAAVARLGDPAMIRREFAKVEHLPKLDRIAFGGFLTLAGLTIVGCFTLLVANLQKVSAQPLLWIHIITITLGYSAGLFAATFAGYATLRSFFSRSQVPVLAGITLSLVRLASVAAVTLSAIGFVLGALWAKENLGRLFTWDPREFGAIFVVASFVVTVLATLRSAVPTRVALALAITAGAAVVAAWFGTAVHRSNYPPLLTIITVAGLAITLGLAALSLRVRSDVAVR